MGEDYDKMGLELLDFTKPRREWIDETEMGCFQNFLGSTYEDVQ